MQCVQCGECVEACPKNCLDMNPKYTEPGTEKVIDIVDVEVKKPAAKDDKGGSANAASGDDDKLIWIRMSASIVDCALKIVRATLLKSTGRKRSGKSMMTHVSSVEHVSTSVLRSA